MKGQPWDLNQTWTAGQKWCRFTNVPQKFRPSLRHGSTDRHEIWLGDAHWLSEPDRLMAKGLLAMFIF